MIENKIEKAIKLIKDSSNIVVFTGAGISTSCGVPDFRSENGLYSIVKQRYKLPYPEAIFEISYFKNNPEPFYSLSKELFTKNITPSISHRFIAYLEEIGKIAIVVTQNIDMLHSKAGSKKVIECHGSYSTAHCLNCKKEYIFKDIEPSILEGEIPYCSCNGLIKPDVVFFGEMLPKSFYEIYQNPPKCDLIIVFGSSLVVQPAASFALMIANKTNSIIVNRDKTDYDSIFDLSLNMEIDKFTEKVWEKLK